MNLSAQFRAMMTILNTLLNEFVIYIHFQFLSEVEMYWRIDVFHEDSVTVSCCHVVSHFVVFSISPYFRYCSIAPTSRPVSKKFMEDWRLNRITFIQIITVDVAATMKPSLDRPWDFKESASPTNSLESNSLTAASRASSVFDSTEIYCWSFWMSTIY